MNHSATAEQNHTANTTKTTYHVPYDRESAPIVGAVFTAIGAFSTPGKALAERKFSELFEQLRADGVIHASSILKHRIFGPHEAARVADEFAAGRVEVIIIVNSAFPNGHVLPTIALHPQLRQTPIIVTASEEAELGDQEWTTNAWCGVIMNNHLAKRIGRYIRPLAGDPSSASYRNELSMLLNCYRAVSLMRKEFLGRFGEAPGGFHSATIDQFAYLHTLGTRVETVDLLAVMDTFDSGIATGYLGTASFTDDEVKATVAEMRTGRPCLVNDESLARGARLYHALRAQVQANGFTSVAVKCWPELSAPGRDLIACLPVTWLMSKGDVRAAACESDCGTAILQSLAALLTGTPAACLDFVNYTGRCAYVELGHCGVGIAGQMGDGETIAYKSPDRQGGTPDHGPALIGQFAYGPKTGLAITQGDDGRLKILTFTGESNPVTAQGKKYSAADLCMPQYRELNELILAHGFPHHLAVAMRNITREIAEVCAVLGIDCYNPKNAA